MDSVATVVPYIMVLSVAGIACGYELGARSGRRLSDQGPEECLT
jgi:hypothetical protein